METKAATTEARGWRTEDWVAVLLGFLVIAAVLALFQWKVTDLRNVVASYRWTTDGQISSLTPGWLRTLDAIAAEAEAKGQKNVAGLSKSLKDALAGQDRKAIEAAAGKMAALGSKTLAGSLGAEVRGHSAADAGARVFTWANLSKVVYVGLAFLVVAAIGMALLGGQVAPFLIGLPVIFGLAWLARFLAGNGLFVNWGIEYVIFSLTLGLLISNTVGVPAWLKSAVQTEFFIKTGLVILGASLLFMEILQAGALGIVQAVLVVFVVWYACFWLCRKLRVDDEFAAMLSTAVSICGVSAAIAACGAINGDKKKLSYVTSLVLIVAVPMMVVMPWIAKSTGMNDLVAGAWLGGTLDTSASVVAAEHRRHLAALPQVRARLRRRLGRFFLSSSRRHGERHAQRARRDQSLVVRHGVSLHRPGDAIRRARGHGARPTRGRLPRRPDHQRVLDVAPRLPAVRRRSLRAARH